MLKGSRNFLRDIYAPVCLRHSTTQYETCPPQCEQRENQRHETLHCISVEKEEKLETGVGCLNNSSPGQVSHHPKTDKVGCIEQRGICHVNGVQPFRVDNNFCCCRWFLLFLKPKSQISLLLSRIVGFCLSSNWVTGNFVNRKGGMGGFQRHVKHIHAENYLLYYYNSHKHT